MVASTATSHWCLWISAEAPKPRVLRSLLGVEEPACSPCHPPTETLNQPPRKGHILLTLRTRLISPNVAHKYVSSSLGKESRTQGPSDLLSYLEKKRGNFLTYAWQEK